MYKILKSFFHFANQLEPLRMDKFRPPTNYSVKTNKHGYKILTEEPDVPTWTTNSGKQNSKSGKRKIFDEDSYFDDDDDPPPPRGSAYDPFNPTGGGGEANQGTALIFNPYGLTLSRYGKNILISGLG